MWAKVRTTLKEDAGEEEGESSGEGEEEEEEEGAEAMVRGHKRARRV